MPVQKKGFTLVELLITISIIGILSAIGLVLYSSVLKQGKDSKRQSDLKSIQLALEQYNNDQGFYPRCFDDPSIPSGCVAQLSDSSYRLTSSSKVYLDKIPVDPINELIASSWYIYYYQKIPKYCDNTTGKYCTSYCLYAHSENSNSIGFGSCDNSGNYGVWFNYAITPP